MTAMISALRQFGIPRVAFPAPSGNMAMKNAAFIGDLPVKTSIYKEFSIAMFDDHRVVGLVSGQNQENTAFPVTTIIDVSPM